MHFAAGPDLIGMGVGPVGQGHHIGGRGRRTGPCLLQDDLLGPVLEGLLVQPDARREIRRNRDRALGPGRDLEGRDPLDGAGRDRARRCSQEGSSRDPPVTRTHVSMLAPPRCNRVTLVLQGLP